jgi:hypothetical protein
MQPTILVLYHDRYLTKNILITFWNNFGPLIITEIKVLNSNIQIQINIKNI